ncbi:MarR family winged helix-turn-helix transcriptional regulator [Subtercola sp. YIM 133946]|uniref:MarR family winged helix-turn-helix transcriptional regulator n=1 Tax=Subtercola sp. YIM 133946 TaxID=3118909 RepID=UPI002F95E731
MPVQPAPAPASAPASAPAPAPASAPPATARPLLSEAPLAHEIEFLAVKAAADGTRHANELLKPLNLKVRSYSVLVLAAGETEPTQRELASFLSLDPSQIVALVDELETKGLVERVVDPADRRSKVITATPAGRHLVARATAATRAAEADSLAALTIDERETLRGLLRKVAFSD